MRLQWGNSTTMDHVNVRLRPEHIHSNTMSNVCIRTHITNNHNTNQQTIHFENKTWASPQEHNTYEQVTTNEEAKDKPKQNKETKTQTKTNQNIRNTTTQLTQPNQNI